MSVREILEKLNKMDREEFRRKMRKAVIYEFFTKVVERRDLCKLISHKQSR